MSWDLLSSREKWLVQIKFLSLSLFSLARCVRLVADWQLFAGEWRHHDREWHQSRARKGWLAWKMVHSPHYLQLLLYDFLLYTCRANLFQCSAIDHFYLHIDVHAHAQLLAWKWWTCQDGYSRDNSDENRLSHGSMQGCFPQVFICCIQLLSFCPPPSISQRQMKEFALPGERKGWICSRLTQILQ